LLVPDHGSDGAAVAYLASVLPVVAFIGYVERRVVGLERSPWPPVFARLAPPVAVEVVCLVLLRAHVTSLPVLLTTLCVSALAVPAMYFGLLASEEDRAIARALVTRDATPPATR
jgi:hypothetical protein